MSWRERAAPIIWRVLDANKGKSKEEIDKALFDAYPFGERKYHPYKIWLDEIRRQRHGIRKVNKRKRGGLPKWREKEDQQRLEEWEGIYGKREEEAAEKRLL